MNESPQCGSAATPIWARGILVLATLLAFWGISTYGAVVHLAGAARPPGPDAESHLARAIELGRVFAYDVRRGKWGEALVLFGGVEPQYPGLVYATLDVAFAALGATYRTVALHNALWMALFLGGMVALGRRVMPLPAALFSACLASALPFMVGGSRSVSLDFNFACLYPWVILGFLRTGSLTATGPSFVAGFLAGVAFLARGHSAFYVWPLPLLLAVGARRSRVPTSDLARGLGACGVGFALSILPYVLRFTAFRRPREMSIPQVIQYLVLDPFRNPEHPFATYSSSPLSLATPSFLLRSLAAGLNPFVLAIAVVAIPLFLLLRRRGSPERRLLVLLFVANFLSFCVVPIKYYDYLTGMGALAALFVGWSVWEIPRSSLRIAAAGASLGFCLAWNTLGIYLPERSLDRLPLAAPVKWTYFLPGEATYRQPPEPGLEILTRLVRELRGKRPRGECGYTFLELQDEGETRAPLAWPLMLALDASERMEGGLMDGCEQARRFLPPSRDLAKIGDVHEQTQRRPLLDEPLILAARETKLSWTGDTVWRELEKKYDLLTRFRYRVPGIALLDVWVWRSKALASTSP